MNQSILYADKRHRRKVLAICVVVVLLGIVVIGWALPWAKASIGRLDPERGLRVIDLSADFRFRNLKLYEAWYQEHIAPEIAAKSVYGMPELFRAQIKDASLVGNPGCYPTSAILALAPLVKHNMIKTNNIIVDSKSGTSGAGRSARTDMLFCEVNESFRAYAVGTHRHTYFKTIIDGWGVVHAGNPTPIAC